MKYPTAIKIKYSINVLIFKRVFLSSNLLLMNKVNREKAKWTKMILRAIPSRA